MEFYRRHYKGQACFTRSTMTDPHGANRDQATASSARDDADFAPMLEIEWRVAWDAGRPPSLCEVTEQVAGLPRAFLVELLLFDQKRRWSLGQEVPVEEYVKLVPVLAADAQSRLDLISGEFTVRRSLGRPVNWDELISRFPTDEPGIRQQALVQTGGAGHDRTMVQPTMPLQDEEATMPAPATNGQSVTSDGCDAPTMPVAPQQPYDAATAETLVGDSLPPTGALPSRYFGNYELLDELGRGGMGVVYRARQRNADRLVALKVIRLDQLHSLSRDTQTTAVDRFRTEAQAAARLNHDNIVTVYEVGEHQGQQFYSMRYVEGQSLAELVRQKPLECRRAAEILEPVSRAVHDAHTHGILHRDLKPHNILIDAASGRPLVADFGLAKLTQGREELTHAGEVMGTPAYMSPEQACDSANVTASSDTYSLGATLYCVLTGRPPFQAATAIETLRQVCDAEPAPPRQLNPQIDLDLETICLKCLEKSPARRYETAAALADDLARYLRGEPIVARPVGPAERAWRWCKRNPLEAVLAGIAVSLLVIASVVSTVAYVTTKRALDDSEQSLREAVEVVNDMLTKVSEDDLLKEPGMQPLRKDLLTRALKWYRLFLQRRTDDPELRREVAMANYRVGRINELLETRREALPAYQTAQRIQRELLDSAPDDADAHRELGDTMNALGNLLQRNAELDKAAEAYQEAIRLRERLVKLDRDKPDFVRLLANSYMNMGVVEMVRGQYQTETEAGESYFQKARAAIAQAQSLRRDLLNRPDDDEEDKLKTKRDLALGHYNLAVIPLSPLGSEEGRRQINEAIGYFEQVAEKTPGDFTNVQRLIQSYRLAAEHAKEAEDFEQARLWQEKALNQVEPLARENPKVPQYQHELARILVSIGQLGAYTNDPEAALAAFMRAKEVLEPLADAYQQSPQFRSDLSLVLREVAGVYSRQERHKLALEALKSARGHVELLTQRHQQDSTYTSVLAEIDAEIDATIAKLK
jgi:tetratricopeptide (TPR) repeat protein/predicted Ser/Thr protein kinase